jgi:hypothetical protein
LGAAIELGSAAVLAEGVVFLGERTIDLRLRALLSGFIGIVYAVRGYA